VADVVAQREEVRSTRLSETNIPRRWTLRSEGREARASGNGVHAVSDELPTHLGSRERVKDTRALGDVMRMLDMPWATWTEEQFDAHQARIEAEREAREKQEREEETQRRVSALNAVGWPMRALEAAVSADTQKPGIQVISAWDVKKRSVLVLSGDPGSGKTVAAAWWALQRAHPARFVRAASFAAQSRYDEEKRNMLDGALVLDDLGAEYNDAKGSFLVDLDELVDSFYGNRRPLVITTNLDAPQFKARYGERINDRLRECGLWKVAGTATLRTKGKS